MAMRPYHRDMAPSKSGWSGRTETGAAIPSAGAAAEARRTLRFADFDATLPRWRRLRQKLGDYCMMNLPQMRTIPATQHAL
jgi:hypothetical protein